MASGGFFGGLAEGFQSTYGTRQKQATLNEQLGLDKQKLALQQEQFEEQKSQFDTDVKLRTRALDLQTTQEQRLKEHQDYQAKLAAKSQEIALRQQDIAEVKDLLLIIKTGQDPKQRAALVDLYAVKLGIDTKSPVYKATQNVLNTMPDDDLADVGSLITDMLPGMQPGSMRALSKSFLTDPTAALNLMRSAQEAKTAAATKSTEPVETVVDPNNPGKEIIVPRSQVITAAQGGNPMQSPGGPQRKTPAEIKLELDLKLVNDQDKEYITKTTEAAGAAVAMVPYVDAFEATLNSGRFPTGTLAGFRATVARGAEFLGLDEAKILKDLGIGDASSAEAMEAVSSQMGLAMAGQMSRLTNLSLEYIKNSMPNLARTPEGNQIILELFKRMAHRGEQVNALYEKYADKGSFRPEGEKSFKQAISDLNITDPVVDQAFRERLNTATEKGKGVDLKALAATANGAGTRMQEFGSGIKLPIVGNQGGKTIVDTSEGQLPVIWTVDDANALAPGTKFIEGRSGNIMVVPQRAPAAAAPAPRIFAVPPPAAVR